MIAHLTGKILSKKPNSVIVEANGVGYELTIPLSTFYELGEEGSQVSLKVFTYMRENTLALYGFKTARERELFERLIEVSGVGPRMAIALLSGASVDDIIEAIRKGDLYRMTSIPGIGKKTAERIALELKDKILKLATAEEYAAAASPGTIRLRDDVVSALANLGYQRSVAERAVARAFAAVDGEAGFEELLKRSLRILAG